MPDIKPKNPTPISSVRIIGCNYRIVHMMGDDEEDKDGVWDDAKKEIRIDPVLSLESFREILWHEILHAIEHRLGLKFTERSVVAMGVGVDLVLQENPELIALYR